MRGPILHLAVNTLIAAMQRWISAFAEMTMKRGDDHQARRSRRFRPNYLLNAAILWQ